MAEILCIAHTPVDLPVLAAFAQRLGGQGYDMLCLTGDCPTDLGAEVVMGCEIADVPPADSLAEGLLPLASKYRILSCVSHMFGKDFMPRLSALLDRPMVSDVLAVHEDKTFTRPMYAGNVMARVRVDSEAFTCSVRATAFQSIPRGGQSRIEAYEIKASGVTKRTSTNEKTAGRPDLTQARVVVSGGRPLRDVDTFEALIGGLADALGGAAGATRAAVDSGIAPNELQVGQTGKIVAPELYIAVGISGSTQHLAGMKESKVIVAINTDPDAPIFEVADYGLVQDLYVAVPEMIAKLK